MDPPDPRTGADDPTPDAPPDGAGHQGMTAGASAFLGLGLSIGVCLAITVGGGLALDAWLHSSPLGLLVGLSLGIVLAVAMVVATVRKYL